MDAHRLSAISQYSDDPSVYPQDYPSPVSAGPPARSHGPPSMLDLGDDRSPDEDEDEEDAQMARLSYMGPKMRFHSRAPWEMDGDALEEEEEGEGEDRLHLIAGLPFARPKTGSSPRPSFQASRASSESSRSHIPPKRSFETINSQISYPLGALYTLAHETMSATALARPRETLRSKFSLGRLRPDTSTGSIPPPPLPPSSPARFQPSPPPFERARESIHPYANPDHAAAYDDDERTSFPNSLYSPSRNDSSMTVTETFPGDSLTRTSLRSATGATITPDSSSNSLAARSRATTISARNISAPVPVLHPPEPDRNQEHLHPHGLPLGTSLPGWHERGTPPAFSLISLEEARAQRMRTTTAGSDAPRPSTSTNTFPRTHMSNSSIDDGETASIFPDASFGNITTRARGRSISAGAKARSALHIIVGQPKSENRRDTELPVPPATVPGKTLKQKKSGFMRLFNAGKAQERDDREEQLLPPPVPALPEHAQQRPGKASVQRIPVPSLSPSLVAAAAAEHDADEALWYASLVTSPKRTPPTLSITTAPPRASDVSEQFAASTSAAQAYATPWTAADQLPQSAPANVSSFNALRLRPMSTLFSAQFGEHIVPLDSEGRSARSSGDTDADTPEPSLDTPRSSSPGMLASPLPKSAPYLRASSEHITDGGALTTAGEGQGQVQIVGSKSDAQRIWELEGRVRDLQEELQAVRGKHGDAFCVHCGRGRRPVMDMLGPSSVVNRPRARTGTSSRFGSVLP